MNKKVFGVLATILTVGVLAGCSAKGTGSTSLDASTAQSQSGAGWPTKPVTIYVPAKAGAGTDMHARILAQYIQKKTGQTATVVDQPDGSGTVAFESVRNAKPDGNTLLFYHSNLIAAYWTGTYDHTYQDFTNLCITTDNGSQAFVVAPDAPYSDLEELVTYAKQHQCGQTRGVSRQTY